MCLKWIYTYYLTYILYALRIGNLLFHLAVPCELGIFTDSAVPLYRSQFTPNVQDTWSLFGRMAYKLSHESFKWYILHYDNFNDVCMSCYECLFFTRSVYYLPIFTAFRFMVRFIFSYVRISYKLYFASDCLFFRVARLQPLVEIHYGIPMRFHGIK